MIKLHDDWKNILLNAWSIRFIVATAILNGFVAGTQMLQPYLNTRPVVIAAIIAICTTLATLTSMLAAYSRIVVQKNVSA